LFLELFVFKRSLNLINSWHKLWGNCLISSTEKWYYLSMNKRDKKIDEIVNNPHKVTFDDLCKFLGLLGYSILSSGGSHYKASKNGERTIYFVKPHGQGDSKYVKETYIKKIIKAIGL
jgi:hypothetical protein